ncbi:MAG TPA: hypothetical protein V6C97_27035, partial [Oculatellaceae cyanobacterium]
MTEPAWFPFDDEQEAVWLAESLAHSLPCKQSQASKSSAHSDDSAGKAMMTECKPGRRAGRMPKAARSAPNRDEPSATAPIIPLSNYQSRNTIASAPARASNKGTELRVRASTSQSFNLESCTHYDHGVYWTEPQGPCWRVDLVDLGDGVVEAIATYQPEPLNLRRKSKIDLNNDSVPEWLREEVKRQKEEAAKKRKDRKEMGVSEENRIRADRRARRQMRHKVMMMKADRLLTLTTRECYSRKELEKVFGRWTRRMRKQFPDFQYIAVFENHKTRDASHIHLALNQFYNVTIMRYHWHRALGWEGKGIARDSDSPGNVHVSQKRQGYWDRHGIAKYLAKYMAKDAESNEAFSKRYVSSQNIQKPLKYIIWIPVSLQPRWAIKELIEKLFGIEIVSTWEAPD